MLVLFKKIDEKTYDATTKRNGTLIGASTWKLSDDGKSMAIDFKRTKANGETYEDSSTYIRTSGNNGLAGSFRGRKGNDGQGDRWRGQGTLHACLGKAVLSVRLAKASAFGRGFSIQGIRRDAATTQPESDRASTLYPSCSDRLIERCSSRVPCRSIAYRLGGRINCTAFILTSSAADCVTAAGSFPAPRGEEV
jgi:hypothetical protein